ncbi:hypothetical protein H0H87_000404 [Tephrocybe sp. NHM501043]|nr:hypothetical protein H0H87_000404 [Tephrocybe sp. NHM501043]
MNVYADLVGLKFNVSKTGSVSIGTAVPASLPTGNICWGFLHFNQDKAQFVIDQKNVDLHIVKLCCQLASTKLVFGWVNVYNKYMAFFFHNFGGQSALCFGAVHVTDIINTLVQIQEELFPNAQGGVVAYLCSVTKTHFNIVDLPQGYFYLLISNDGLKLHHPIVEMFGVELDRHNYFKDFMETKKKRYKVLKKDWDLHYRITKGSFMIMKSYTSLQEMWLL